MDGWMDMYACISLSFFYPVVIICAYGGDVREIMLNALDLGLINGDYVFITIHLLEGEIFS